MEEIIRGALFQDNRFEFTDLNGLQLEKLISCEDQQSNDVIMVYIKVKNKEWHQFFLDVGYCFWQNYEDIDPTDEQNIEQEYTYVNKSIEWKLLDATITKIYCVPEQNNCRITIEFDNKKMFILKTIEPQIFDSNCELLFISSL